MILPLGGTELAYNELRSRMSDLYKEKINIICSGCHFESIDRNKVNILWQQLSYDQENIRNITNPEFVKLIDAFVFVSHWQYEKFKKMFDIPSHKSVVIQNATRKFPIHDKPKNDKLKLIYTSMPYRGLDTLIDVVQQINRSDIELDIYSSTIIYGSHYDKSMKNVYKGIFDQARNVQNAYLKGYASNDEIRTALQQSHIMLYPCIFEETSCMSAIEALSAGCKVLCNNLGALPETCGTWADIITFDTDKQIAIKRFKKLLNQSIDTYWTDEVQTKLKEQTIYYSKYWSWDHRINQWNKLFDRVLEIKNG